MSRLTIILVLLSNSVWLSYGQTEADSIRRIVLENNEIGTQFKFGEWKETGETETRLIYLGVIKSSTGTYKLMTSVWIWGLSQRATSRILLFNEGDELLGNYYVTMSDLPEKIENNQLVFLHTQSNECDKSKITRLSFEKGIPSEFFLECNDDGGEIYTFDKE